MCLSICVCVSSLGLVPGKCEGREQAKPEARPCRTQCPGPTSFSVLLVPQGTILGQQVWLLEHRRPSGPS